METLRVILLWAFLACEVAAMFNWRLLNGGGKDRIVFGWAGLVCFAGSLLIGTKL